MAPLIKKLKSQIHFLHLLQNPFKVSDLAVLHGYLTIWGVIILYYSKIKVQKTFKTKNKCFNSVKTYVELISYY